MSGARINRFVVTLGAGVLGAVITVSLQGGASAPAAPAPAPVATAAVVRTNVVSSVLTGGTLGYAVAAPVVNQLSGMYTELPVSGARIPVGGTLYRVDNVPVTLLAGSTPAWRALSLGVSDGPDVAELQANLISLGDAGGLLSAPTGHFDVLTADAVERWQTGHRETATGEIPLGQIAFLAGPVRVGAARVAPGQAASPGQEPYQVTTTKRTVTVPLGPTLPPVHPGEAVRVILPSGAAIRGTVTAIGLATPSGSGRSQAEQVATVTPARPSAAGAGVSVQVALTTQSVRDVLAVPVSALLALAGGGYGLEVVEPGGAHRLVGVRTGAFGGGRVQVSGTAISLGTRVVVAQ